MNRLRLAVLATCCLTGCASISSVPLQSDGMTVVPGSTPGFRYYLPRPYLIVTEIPAPASPSNGSTGNAGFGASQGQGNSKGQTGSSGNNSSGSKPSPQDAQPTSSSPATPSDLSFSASSNVYEVKLIYLPDYRHPMAVTLNTGLFGTAGLQLTIQDGWMLTSVSANTDNSKLADVVTAALQAVGGASSGGATKAASASLSGAKSAAGLAGGRVLAPGLYSIDFDRGSNRVATVCAVSYFDSTGSHAPSKDDPGACGPDMSSSDIAKP